MNVSSARALSRGLLAATALSLALPACERTPPDRNGPAPKPSYEISYQLTWTSPTTGERYCPQYAGNTVVDAGDTDVILRDAATGKTKWSYRKSASCPLVTAEAVYVASEGEVVALDLKTGKHKAVTKGLDTLGNHDGDAPVETPAGIHALIDGNIDTVDKSLKRTLWEHEEETDIWIDHIAASGTTVIAVTQNGKVKALSGKDGKVLWVYATPSHGQVAEEVSIADGIVYIASMDGSVYALSLATGEKVWATKLGHGEAWATHLSRNLVITSDNQLVYGLDKKTGKKKWSRSGDYNWVTATADHAIYADSEAGEVTVLDATTGTRLTTIPEAPGASWLATSPTHLYVWTDTEIQAHQLTKQATD